MQPTALLPNTFTIRGQNSTHTFTFPTDPPLTIMLTSVDEKYDGVNLDVQYDPNDPSKVAYLHLFKGDIAKLNQYRSEAGNIYVVEASYADQSVEMIYAAAGSLVSFDRDIDCRIGISDRYNSSNPIDSLKIIFEGQSSYVTLLSEGLDIEMTSVDDLTINGEYKGNLRINNNESIFGVKGELPKVLTTDSNYQITFIENRIDVNIHHCEIELKRRDGQFFLGEYVISITKQTDVNATNRIGARVYLPK